MAASAARGSRDFGGEIGSLFLLDALADGEAHVIPMGIDLDQPPMRAERPVPARPTVLFARATLPNTPAPLANPSRSAADPLRMVSGVAECVVACTPCRLKRSSQAARTIGTSTSRYSGLQPAMTALA